MWVGAASSGEAAAANEGATVARKRDAVSGRNRVSLVLDHCAMPLAQLPQVGVGFNISRFRQNQRLLVKADRLSRQ